MRMRVRWNALCHFSAMILSVFTVFIGGAFLTYGILKWVYRTFGNREPSEWSIPLTIVPVVVGLVLLTIRAFKRMPVACPYCDGKGYLSDAEDKKEYVCSACGKEFGTFEWNIKNSLKKAGKVLLIATLGPIVIVMLTLLLGIGGPVIFLMFLGIYFALGPLLQNLVRVVPQPDKENQPTPWPQYFGFAYTYVIGVGAVLAVFRLIVRLPMGSVQDSFFFLPLWDILFGACGLAYSFVSFSKEGLWRYRQVLAVRDLATTAVAGTAVGLVELTGVARREENPSGPLDSSRTIMSFFWHLLGTEPHYQGGVMLGSYRNDLHPFYLDDGTGRILVDPVHERVELRRPFISVLTTFFGRRTFEILLTGHVGRPSWIERDYALREGDRIYVIGHAEVCKDAPTDAIGPDRLVVRPREQARSGGESLLQFLIPFGKKASRTPHDVFVISDSGEQKAKGLLRKNFLFSIMVPIALALISASLIIMAR